MVVLGDWKVNNTDNSRRNQNPGLVLRETYPVHGISPTFTRDTSKDGKTSCDDIIILSDTKVRTIPILFTYTPGWTWSPTATH